MRRQYSKDLSGLLHSQHLNNLLPYYTCLLNTSIVNHLTNQTPQNILRRADGYVNTIAKLGGEISCIVLHHPCIWHIRLVVHHTIM